MYFLALMSILLEQLRVSVGFLFASENVTPFKYIYNLFTTPKPYGDRLLTSITFGFFRSRSSGAFFSFQCLRYRTIYTL